jgi:hypothetical protein
MYQGHTPTLDVVAERRGTRRELEVLKETAARLAERIYAAAAEYPSRRSLDALRVANAAIAEAKAEEERYIHDVVGPRLHAAARAMREAATSSAAERALVRSGTIRQGLRAQRESEELDQAEVRACAALANAAVTRGPVEAFRDLVDTLSFLPA